eukprot:1208546-Rhodomonas_salina.1
MHECEDAVKNAAPPAAAAAVLLRHTPPDQQVAAGTGVHHVRRVPASPHHGIQGPAGGRPAWGAGGGVGGRERSSGSAAGTKRAREPRAHQAGIPCQGAALPPPGSGTARHALQQGTAHPGALRAVPSRRHPLAVEPGRAQATGA